MKLIRLNTGEEVKGVIAEETDDVLTIDIEVGQMRINKVNITETRDILDCTQVEVGKFVQTPRGVYIKTDAGTFRLIKGPLTSPIDLSSIEDGTVATYADIFPEHATEGQQ